MSVEFVGRDIYICSDIQDHRKCSIGMHSRTKSHKDSIIKIRSGSYREGIQFGGGDSDALSSLIAYSEDFFSVGDDYVVNVFRRSPCRQSCLRLISIFNVQETCLLIRYNVIARGIHLDDGRVWSMLGLRPLPWVCR